MSIQLGLNPYLRNEEYHADRTFYSSSVLKTALRDIRLFYNKYIKMEHIEKTGEALTLGSYVHCRILEPEKVSEEFCEFDGLRRGKLWDEFLLKNPNKTILGNMTKKQGDNIVRSIQNHPNYAELFTGGDAEVTAAVNWTVPVKVRADYKIAETGRIVDIKTTSGSLTVEGVQSTIVRYDYDLSAALYVDAFSEIEGIEYDFYFVFASKDFDDCAVFKASKSMIANGRRKYTKAMDIIRKGLDSGKWIEGGIQEIDVPFYGIMGD